MAAPLPRQGARTPPSGPTAVVVVRGDVDMASADSFRDAVVAAFGKHGRRVDGCPSDRQRSVKYSTRKQMRGVQRQRPPTSSITASWRDVRDSWSRARRDGGSERGDRRFELGAQGSQRSPLVGRP